MLSSRLKLGCKECCFDSWLQIVPINVNFHNQWSVFSLGVRFPLLFQCIFLLFASYLLFLSRLFWCDFCEISKSKQKAFNCPYKKSLECGELMSVRKCLSSLNGSIRKQFPNCNIYTHWFYISLKLANIFSKFEN